MKSLSLIIYIFIHIIFKSKTFQKMQNRSTAKLENKETQRVNNADNLSSHCKKVAIESVYIPPKNMPKQDSCSIQDPQSQIQDNHQQTQNAFKIPKKQSKPIISEAQRQALQKLQNDTKRIPEKKFHNFYLNIIEIFIWVGFLISSVPKQAYILWVDIGINGFCVIKIVITHIYIAYLNKKFDKDDDQNNAEVITEEINYSNRILMHQIFQVWSIITTIFGVIFMNHQIVFRTIISLKAIRLFFPMAINFNSSKDMPIFEVFVHMLKLIFTGAFITLLISLFVGYMYTENKNYVCIQKQDLVSLYENEFEAFQPTKYELCGLTIPCPNNQTCFNIYRYANGPQDYSKIAQVQGNKNLANFDNTVLNSFLLASNPGGIFESYEGTEYMAILFGIVMIVWYIYFCWGAVTVGETLRSQTLHDWQKKELKQVCFYRITGEQLKQKEKRRNSNISFNLQRYKRNVCNQNSTDSMQTVEGVDGNLQLSEQFQHITQQITKRTVLQKLMTILFNIVCLSQVILVFLDNMDLDTQIDTQINIALGVYFIIWTLGIIAVFIQFKFSTTHREKNQIFIIFYETTAYSITLLDYIIRVSQQQFKIEKQNFVTPFSHAAISLRVLYIIYNNGFDGQISCYYQKILRNIWLNTRMIGFILITGLFIGLINCYWLINNQFGREQVGIINNWTLMSTGFGGNLNNSLASILIFSFLKLLSGVFGLYIAKNVNLGYDSIFDVDLPIPNQEEQNCQQIILSENTFGCITAQNLFRKFCLFLHSITQYQYIKCIGLCIYMILSFIRIDEQQKLTSVSTALFSLDVWIILDIFTQIIAYRPLGRYSYFDEYKIVKIINCLIQIYLFVIFFVDAYQILSLTIFFRITRALIIVQNTALSKKVSDQMVTIFFQSKIKYYKIILSSFALIFIGLTLTARFTSQNSISSDNKIFNSFAFAVNFVYSVGFGFQTISLEDDFSILALNIIAIFFSTFYHVLTVFMIVTYFVVTKNKISNQQNDLIVQQFTSANPQQYDYVINTGEKVFSYLKIVKIVIILISLCQISLLFGLIQSKNSEENRLLMSSINLFFVFLEIFIYLYEHIWIKKPKFQWSIVQGIVIIISIPGSVFMMFPIANFSGSFQLKMVIKIFICLAILRICRIFPLLINRQSFSFTLWRRIKNTIPFAQFTSAIIILIAIMLPFAISLAIIKQKNLFSSVLGFIGGPSFSSKPQNTPYILQFIIISLGSFLYLPLKSYCLAKIISSFLTNNPTWLTLKKDEMKTIVASTGLLNHNRSNLYAKNAQFYRFSAGILKLLPKNQQLIQRNNITIKYDYNYVLGILKELNIQVYVAEQDNQKLGDTQKDLVMHGDQQKSYAILISDLIYFLYCYAIRKQMSSYKGQIKSLISNSSNRLQRMNKTQMGTRQYSTILGLKSKLIHKIANKSRYNLAKIKGEETNIYNSALFSIQ